MSLRIQQKAVTFAGLAYIAMAIFHIPDNTFPHGFDKNAPAQLVALCVIAVGFLLYVAIKTHRFNFHRLVVYGAAALLVTQFASLLMSGSLLSSLIGDSGRFVGVLSVIALLSISLFHTQFNFEVFLNLLRFYVLAVQLVVIVGLAQHFELIELPGSGGVTSTLGNLDFFAAYVATSLPLLIILALRASRRVKALILSLALLDIYALYLAGPLQGYLDIAFVLVGIIIFLFRKYIPRPKWSLNARTYLGTFAVIIWAEFIFLMPFLGDFVPVLGDDVQVKIRSNFWLAGMRQFFDHPLLGVGPDQYGNNYEQYRTLEDIVKYTNILSNDAHSASVQTLATLGILGTGAFLFLLALVIRSLLIIWDRRLFDRRATFFIGLFIFVYLTNSFVSPFTLSHKYLLWAVCGFLIGQVYRVRKSKKEIALTSKFAALGFAALVLSVVAPFVQGQLNFLQNIERYAENNSAQLDYQPSSFLPCTMYFDAELLIAKNLGIERAKTLAEEEIANNPRCVAAHTYLAEVLVNSGEVEGLDLRISKLLEVAPARNTTFSYAMYYANRVGDNELRLELEEQMKKLGLVYIPGNLG